LNRTTDPFLFPQVFTYPMEMYVARHVLDVAVFQTMLGKGPITSARHYALTVGIWALTIPAAAAPGACLLPFHVKHRVESCVAFGPFWCGFGSWNVTYHIWLGVE